MVTGRSRNLTSCLILAALLPLGCAQPGPFTSRQTMVGSLKASVSQLEFENEKLRKEVGDLKADNSRLDTQLAQERDANGEITARLDDAKDLIRRQGGNAQALGGTPKNFEDDNIPPPVATPRGQRTKSSRKPPAARIPQIEAAPFGSSTGDDLGYQPANRTPRDLGPTDVEEEDRWLPVARGLGTTVTRQ
jgi:hypothetical protein